MIINTRLEDLSNDIFFEIFDYFHAIDIFYAFTSLNSRFSLILKSIRLHVIIFYRHYRRQIEFLSHHLKFHSNQVVSLNIHDQTRNQINVITFLFNQHQFLNLYSCIFFSMTSSSNSNVVLEQLSKSTKLVCFRIIQSDNAEDDNLNKCDADKLSQLILINPSLTLRSADLSFHHDHFSISKKFIFRTNLTHLKLIFYGSLNRICIYSLIPILRRHSLLRYLHVIIKTTELPLSKDIK
ncbi:hypothetical protein I4U23_003366 [Adineta vaga]|nr:hypothetical protein I4U23_003366 [Adineta vaga]